MNKVFIALGFVSVATLSAAEPIKIVALGDSLTHGYGLPQGDGFVPQLQAWLSTHGASVELVNAGVSGDTTAGGLSRIGWSLEADVDGLIVALGGNDLLRGIAPDVSRANLRGILTAAENANVEVLLVGMQAPGNYGPDYKADFDAMYPELAAEFDTLLLDSFLAGLPSRDPSELSEYLQADGIHPNQKGVKRIVEAFGPKVQALEKRARASVK